jgi:predicted nucleic acid-binding protein
MVFVDTSFLVAALNPTDDRFDEAVALTPVLGKARLLTTNHVVGESWTVAGRRYGRHTAVGLLHSLRHNPRYAVIHVTPEAEQRALDWLLQHDEREYSFVDATSFETMRERGIREALAFDQDFEAAGFRTLRA